ncbi:MAG: hypothetical protein CO001_03735 [Candidatus Portnoybacteria bacterium CG_4_8_14_3_um_filter_40_10]|uniref:Uncharacterized protein n=2 Tax=Candidatus Portnoyibacteriota TaxID=1817913 RepID=A0A2M7IHL7_9BACT|nr:MAG: hypothetical protein CO001_03735 [Candidatus Portnoybacteria bacterium CG_4_8_14_3_um_filter_40_10]PJA64672.1 MAG: hypothetical protein CO159_01810 [Candidatus Portnoybacteria bacterium CG_4_9_14_3_um_filter_40_10]
MFEKYSRENFEEAKKKKEESEELRAEGAREANPLYAFAVMTAELQKRLAARKFEKIEGFAQEEAEKLNEEYEQLKRKIIDDIEALRNFEREKLGMSEKENK